MGKNQAKDFKDWLSENRNLREEIYNLEELKCKEFARAVYQSPVIDEAVQHSAMNSSEAKDIAFTALSAEIDDLQAKALTAQTQILKCIGHLPDSFDRVIMTDLYLRNMKIAEIAEKRGCDESTVHRHRDKAIKYILKNAKLQDNAILCKSKR